MVGSPDPPPPYKTTRAFPKLTVKQPLSLTPEPGTNRLFMLRHDNVWAGPGHLAAIDDNQNASHVEDLLKIDGLAYGVAFHPDYEHNGYIYIGLSGPLNGRKATQVAATRSIAGRRIISIQNRSSSSSIGPPTVTTAAT